MEHCRLNNASRPRLRAPAQLNQQPPSNGATELSVLVRASTETHSSCYRASESSLALPTGQNLDGPGTIPRYSG